MVVSIYLMNITLVTCHILDGDSNQQVEEKIVRFASQLHGHQCGTSAVSYQDSFHNSLFRL